MQIKINIPEETYVRMHSDFVDIEDIERLKDLIRKSKPILMTENDFKNIKLKQGKFLDNLSNEKEKGYYISPKIRKAVLGSNIVAYNRDYLLDNLAREIYLLESGRRYIEEGDNNA